MAAAAAERNAEVALKRSAGCHSPVAALPGLPTIHRAPQLLPEPLLQAGTSCASSRVCDGPTASNDSPPRGAGSLTRSGLAYELPALQAFSHPSCSISPQEATAPSFPSFLGFNAQEIVPLLNLFTCVFSALTAHKVGKGKGSRAQSRLPHVDTHTMLPPLPVLP